MNALCSVGRFKIAQVLPSVIFPVLFSNVLHPLVAFGGKIQRSDNLFRTVFAMRFCPDIELNYSYELMVILPIGLLRNVSPEPIGLGRTAEYEEKVSELRDLIKSVTKDGPRQVRDIFEVNSLDILLVFLVLEYSQVKKYTDLSFS